MIGLCRRQHRLNAREQSRPSGAILHDVLELSDQIGGGNVFSNDRFQLLFVLLQWFDLCPSLGQGLLLLLGHPAKKPAKCQQGAEQTEHRGHKINRLGPQLLLLEVAGGHEVQLHRALGQVADAQAHDFPELVRDPRHVLQVDRWINLDVPEGIEVIHRQVQLFRKELGCVGQQRGSPRQIQLGRHRAALLATVELDRLIHLDVQTSHDLPRNLGDERLLGIAGLLVGTAQTDEAFLDLHLLGFLPLHLHLVGEVQGYGVGPNVDGAGIDPARLEEEEVAAAGTDVQQHDAALGVAVIKPVGVAQCGRRDVHQAQVQIRLLAHAEEAFYHVVLDGDQQHFQFASRGAAQNLIVPNDLLQRERHVLLGLVLDDLGNLAGIRRRQLHELGKDLKPRSADIDAFCAERTLHARRQRLLQCFEDDQLPVLLRQPRLPHAPQGVILQPQRTRLIRLKLRDLEGRGPEINAEK